MIPLAAIEAAAKRIKGLAIKTPLLESPYLNAEMGRRILVKAECLQMTGSFKFRGAMNAIALAKEAGAQGIIAYSSGNHAQGVAYAARHHGLPVKILMPADAPKIKIENTRKLGADVVLFDRATEVRDDVALRENPDGALTLIKPFDNENVIAGQGTVGLEIADQAAERGIDRAEVLVCCGGGGLTAGVATALAGKAPNMPTRPIEPAGFDDVIRSLASGQIEENASLTGSICDAVITKAPGHITFPILQAHCSEGIVVTDTEARRAMAVAWERFRIVLEPGGAISLAAALFHADDLSNAPIIAVASGGNVDPDLFIETLTAFGTAS